MDHRRPRVIVADDHEGMRDLIGRVLSADCDVVASVANGKELMDAVDSLEADVLVIDIAMPVVNGLDALRAIRSHGVTVPAVILTNTTDSAILEESLRIGASGFVVKDHIATDFRPAVRAALCGERFVSGRKERDC
jgi:DNA-binding NarL/FixJ family response regulator